MKCPKCVENGQRSKAYNEGTSVTLMSYQPWYDEDGVYHDHDGNWRTTMFRCSNGHRWERKYHKACPAGDFGDAD